MHLSFYCYCALIIIMCNDLIFCNWQQEVQYIPIKICNNMEWFKFLTITIFYISLFVSFPIFSLISFPPRFYCVSKLKCLCVSWLIHWTPLCLSILDVVCLVWLVFIHFHSALLSVFQCEWEALSCSCSLIFYVLLYFPFFCLGIPLFSFSVTFPIKAGYTGGNRCIFSPSKTHNKLFHFFQFLFVSAATVTSNLLQGERTKPLCAVNSCVEEKATRSFDWETAAVADCPRRHNQKA